MPNIASYEARQVANAQYGSAMAGELLDEIREWHAIACAVLELDDSERHLNVYYDPSNAGQAPFVDPNNLTIHIPLSKSLAEQYREEIPAALVHENAHRKRALTLLQVGDYTSEIFSYFMDEGLATLAEDELVGDGSAWTFDTVIAQDSTFIDGLLLDLLFYTKVGEYGVIDTPEVNRYLYGKGPRTTMRCYKVGHYIASSAARCLDLTLVEALCLPDAEYRNFAEQVL